MESPIKDALKKLLRRYIFRLSFHTHTHINGKE